MADLMIERWNEVVDKNDTVLYLGDFSAGLKGRKAELIEIADKLNGKKHLIKGNHDYLGTDFYLNKLGFESVEPFYIYKDYFFCHYPLIKYEKYPNVEVNLLIDVFNGEKCKYTFHGHQHSNEPPEHKDHFNVGVDRNNFKPVIFIDKIKELGWG